jgi:hypothetical protein
MLGYNFGAKEMYPKKKKKKFGHKWIMDVHLSVACNSGTIVI